MPYLFEPISLDSYGRREHFEHFAKLKLTYSATVMIDVTELRGALKAGGYKAYPAQIWLLTAAANRIPEFRMSVDPEGTLGRFDHLDPLYTTLDGASNQFSGLHTPFHAEFDAFYKACIADTEQFTNGRFAPQGELPPNLLNVSSLPWIDFTAFNLNLPTDYLLPILTIGKYVERGGRSELPLAIQVHHAVCDGFHLGQFVEAVRDLAASPSTWLPGR
jgi:chloramphenicol O-acetyltransferase type A